MIKAKSLVKAHADIPLFDAYCLLEDICGISRAQVTLGAEIDDSGARAFESACKRRADGEPLQYILGKWEFMGLEFSVNDAVLIPRADTETLVEYILENYTGAPRVLDMCCGSGCIGLSVKHFLPGACVTLADISEKALEVAEQNAKKLGLDVTIMRADLREGCANYFEDSSFDIIVCNPPYIKTKDMAFLSREVKREPALALDGGEDGADFYRVLAADWGAALSKNGELILETGYDTARAVYSLLAECGWRDIVSRRDLGGIIRLVSAKKGVF